MSDEEVPPTLSEVEEDLLELIGLGALENDQIPSEETATDLAERLSRIYGTRPNAVAVVAMVESLCDRGLLIGKVAWTGPLDEPCWSRLRLSRSGWEHLDGVPVFPVKE